MSTSFSKREREIEVCVADTDAHRHKLETRMIHDHISAIRRPGMSILHVV